MPASRTPTFGWVPTTGPDRSRHISDFPTTTGRSPTPRCAAWASAHAAKKMPARCAPATWRRAKRSTPRAGRAHLLVGIAAGRSARRRLAERRGEGRARSVPVVQSLQDANVRRTSIWRPTRPSSLSHYYEGRSRPLQRIRFRPDRSVGTPCVTHAAPCECARPVSADPQPRRIICCISIRRAGCRNLRRRPSGPGLRPFRAAVAPKRRQVPAARSRMRRRAPDLLCYCGLTLSRITSSPILPRRRTRCSRMRVSRSKCCSAIVCCGRPLYDFGMLEQGQAVFNRARWMPWRRKYPTGTPIVVLEPSCASVFKDEASNLMPDDPRTAKLKQQTMAAERVSREIRAWIQAGADGHGQMLVHMHCHHRSIFNMKDEVAVLSRDRRRGKGARFGLLRHGGAVRLRKEELRRVTDTRRARVVAGGPRRRSPAPSSSPTDSVAASRSRRTQIAAPYMLRKCWQGGFDHEDHTPRRQSRRLLLCLGLLIGRAAVQGQKRATADTTTAATQFLSSLTPEQRAKAVITFERCQSIRLALRAAARRAQRASVEGNDTAAASGRAEAARRPRSARRA